MAAVKATAAAPAANSPVLCPVVVRSDLATSTVASYVTNDGACDFVVPLVIPAAAAAGGSGERDRVLLFVSGDQQLSVVDVTHGVVLRPKLSPVLTVASADAPGPEVFRWRSSIRAHDQLRGMSVWHNAPPLVVPPVPTPPAAATATAVPAASTVALVPADAKAVAVPKLRRIGSQAALASPSAALGTPASDAVSVTTLVGVLGNRIVRVDVPYPRQLTAPSAASASQLAMGAQVLAGHVTAGGGARSTHVGHKARFDQPADVLVTRDGRVAYVCDRDNRAIRRIDLTPRSSASGGGGGGGNAAFPMGHNPVTLIARLHWLAPYAFCFARDNMAYGDTPADRAFYNANYPLLTEGVWGSADAQPALPCAELDAAPRKSDTAAAAATTAPGVAPAPPSDPDGDDAWPAILDPAERCLLVLTLPAIVRICLPVLPADVWHRVLVSCGAGTAHGPAAWMPAPLGRLIAEYAATRPVRRALQLPIRRESRGNRYVRGVAVTPRGAVLVTTKTAVWVGLEPPLAHSSTSTGSEPPRVVVDSRTRRGDGDRGLFRLLSGHEQGPWCRSTDATTRGAARDANVLESRYQAVSGITVVDSERCAYVVGGNHDSRTVVRRIPLPASYFAV